MQFPAPASLLSAEPFPEEPRGCRTLTGWGAMETLAPGHRSQWLPMLLAYLAGIVVFLLHMAAVVLFVPTGW